MPNLINSDLAQNYRKSAPSTRFGTPELVHILLTFNDLDMTDYDTVDGNFHNVVMIVQRFAEIYAVGAAQYGGETSTITFIVKADTLTDRGYSIPGQTTHVVNSNANTLDEELTAYFEQSVSVNFTTMFGISYD
jgi:hypothetical protein